MEADSTLVIPPDLGPGPPVYPQVAQLVRVSAAAIAGTAPPVYPAFVQQFSPPLSLRDREACYVIEPNRIALGAAYYDSRLVGNYLGLPLFETTCCVLGGFSSSSSPRSSSSAAMSSDLTINVTLVNGGTAGGVLYTDGSKLQSAQNVNITPAGNLEIAGGKPAAADVATSQGVFWLKAS